MMRRLLVGLAVVALGGCSAPAGVDAHRTTPRTSPSPSPSSRTSPASTGQPPTGSGPSATYHIEPQPPPGSCHYANVNAAAGLVLPDPVCTPGASSPAVTQGNVTSTICKSGYTSTIRPPQSITGPEKAASIRAYSYTGKPTDEYDHLISLELGGSPNDSRNLWPEPNSTLATGFLNPKDTIENTLHALVCATGKHLPLAAAQRLIATDWTTALAEAQKNLIG